ncbi:hypothetical protein QBC39DRAFT_251811 [Podospora conica]|nr:hypothetical protein QBC39DRAFT_251811 [Schizothecium conicum]
MISNAIISMLFRTKKKTALDNTSDNPGEDFGSSLDKHQLRRAQVRKAQIQHRQRKANYVKQLEIDVARIRELITNTQREAEALRNENDSIRVQVEQRGLLQTISPPLPLLPEAAPDIPLDLNAIPLDLNATPLDFNAIPLDLGMAPTMPLDFDNMDTKYPFNELTMSLTFDDILNAPTFRIKSSSSSSSSNRELSPPSHLTTPEPISAPTPALDPTEEAINFVLALEHICRNHFHPTNFSPTSDHPFRRASGHTLMASSLALASAPRAVFSAVSHATPLLRRAAPRDVPEACEWSAAGLTLQALHGLACSISDAAVEVAPVQAWFELAARVPAEVLLRREVLDALKRELAPVVRCPHFGAQMERGAFESVVGRVLGGVLVGGGGGVY